MLDVRDLSVPDEHGGLAVDSISFDVRAGEILGIAGVQGNGQTELCEALMGLRPSTGSVLLAAARTSPGRAPVTGSGRASATYPRTGRKTAWWAPSRRREPGARRLRPAALCRGASSMKPDAIRKAAVQLVDEYDVRTPSVLTAAGTLSGGNQQKVVVARELSRRTSCCWPASPPAAWTSDRSSSCTREIVKQRDQGVAVIIVSSELDEIYALSDRIAVMYEGKIVGFARPTSPEQELGLLMAGAGEQSLTASRAAARPRTHPMPTRSWSCPAPLADQPAPRAEEPSSD